MPVDVKSNSVFPSLFTLYPIPMGLGVANTREEKVYILYLGIISVVLIFLGWESALRDASQFISTRSYIQVIINAPPSYSRMSR